MKLLGIDPGIRACGLAMVKNGKIHGLMTLKAGQNSSAQDMAETIAGLGAFRRADFIVCENYAPEFWRGRLNPQQGEVARLIEKLSNIRQIVLQSAQEAREAYSDQDIFLILKAQGYGKGNSHTRDALRQALLYEGKRKRQVS